MVTQTSEGDEKVKGVGDTLTGAADALNGNGRQALMGSEVALKGNIEEALKDNEEALRGEK